MLRIEGRMLLTSMALVAVLTGTAAAAEADQARLRRRVEDRLKKADVGGNVQVLVEGGRVVLEGFVTTARAKTDAEKAAARESRDPVNRLRVVPDELMDAAILDSAEKAILSYVRYGVFDSVGVGVENGVATLAGSVRDPDRRADIERRVAGLAGVREVRNQIGVQSASLFDERLRQQLAKAIYGELLQRFASSPNPPVRIVVTGGRVTLTGYVGSRLEQAMLGHLARGFPAFAVDNRVEIEREGRPPEPASAGSSEG